MRRLHTLLVELSQFGQGIAVYQGHSGVLVAEDIQLEWVSIVEYVRDVALGEFPSCYFPHWVCRSTFCNAIFEAAVVGAGKYCGRQDERIHLGSLR